MSQLDLIRGGCLLADIDDAIQETVRAVLETGKSGAVNIKLQIKPATKNGTNVIIADEVMTKLPKMPTGETMLFTSASGCLSESDPRQGKLNFERVAVTEKGVDEETGEVQHFTKVS